MLNLSEEVLKSFLPNAQEEHRDVHTDCGFVVIFFFILLAHISTWQPSEIALCTDDMFSFEANGIEENTWALFGQNSEDSTDNRATFESLVSSFSLRH